MPLRAGAQGKEGWWWRTGARPRWAWLQKTDCSAGIIRRGMAVGAPSSQSLPFTRVTSSGPFGCFFLLKATMTLEASLWSRAEGEEDGKAPRMLKCAWPVDATLRAHFPYLRVPALHMCLHARYCATFMQPWRRHRGSTRSMRNRAARPPPSQVRATTC